MPDINIIGPSRTESDGTPGEPLWTATASLIKEDHQYSFRNLFLDRNPRVFNPFGTPLQMLLPGTVAARCTLKKVDLVLEGVPYEWKPANLTLTLLLAAASKDWFPQDDTTVFDTPQMTLVAGEIPLSSPPGQVPWATHFPVIANAQNLSVHASGLSFDGQASFDWEDAAVTELARFHVMLPFGTDPSMFRISLDRGGLREAAKLSLRKSFDHLQSLLQPPTGPVWAAIELAAKSDVPQFYWENSAPGAWVFGLEQGEISVILADRDPGDADRNIATLTPPALIRKTGDALTLTINNYQGQNDGSPWKYHWKAADGESVAVKEIDMGFDPVATSAFLRGVYRLGDPQPGSEASAANPMLLWGFQPLEDGYAELPFFNLNEQILFDIFPVQPPSSSSSDPSLIAGALSYGNDLSGEPEGVPADEHPWSATLLNADSVTGQWAFTRDPNSHLLVLSSADLHLFNPQLVLNGMLWLAASPPTSADLLPAPDNWLTGMHQVALSTPRPNDALQAPFSLHISSLGFQRKLPSPNPESRAVALTEITFSWQVNPAKFINSADHPAKVTILEGLLSSGNKLFNRDNLWQSSALLWRSHPALPTIQSLPLTQNQNPANAPSASRQYAPFDLPADQEELEDWTFSASGNGASAWPRYTGTKLTPSLDWTGPSSNNPYPCVIPMAALSLPGLAFDPLLSPLMTTAADFLPAQYSFGLPYLDEVYAFSDVPKDVTDDPEQLPASVALTRDGYQKYWQALSEKAYLARADSDGLFSKPGTQTVADSLIEPFSWPVQASLADAEYPGNLAIQGGSVPMNLSGAGALQGIDGFFKVDSNWLLTLVAPDPAALRVIAGSLAAEGSAGQLRDQRGLLRSATQVVGNTLVTPVESKAHAGLCLLTALSPIELPQGWNLWVRDLPVSSVAVNGPLVFDRSLTRSAAARGVNDPGAQSAHWNELTGYEWRLGLPDHTPLMLYGLTFMPLTLERAEFDSLGVLTNLIVSGRLLPPWAEPASEVTRANAVRLQWKGAPLVLTGVTPEPRDSDNQTDVPPLASEHAGEWLLGAGEDSPRLLWDDISLGTNSIVLNGTNPGLLDFIFWGRRWQLSLGPLTFSTGSPVSIGIAGPSQSGWAAQIAQVNLNIDLTTSKASLAAMLLYQWGKGEELLIEATETVSIFGDVPQQPAQVFLSRIRNGQNEGLLELDVDQASPPAPASTAGAFQASFSGIKAPDATLFQLFPGMHLTKQGALTGYVTVAFGVNGISSDGSVPPLNATAAFAEVLISADWGDFLQESGQSKGRLYGSSAGRLRCSYTASSSLQDSQKTTWQSRLLLNGFIEVKNLISWPIQTGDLSTFVIPVATADVSLNHTRHTIRILLNQHQPVEKLLLAGPDRCLFGFADSCGWQFLAVTEHQCVDIIAEAATNDRRWTTVQEVRLLTPALFTALLTEAHDQNYYTVQPSSLQGIADPHKLEDTDASYLHKKLRDVLIADNPAVNLHGALIVEASAAHWVKAHAEDSGGFSTLQYLPGFQQQGTLSVLRDFDVSPADDATPWRLLSMPFLGRLQDQSRDNLDAGTSPAPDSVFQVDPILTLQRSPTSSAAQLLASWTNSGPLIIPVAHFDRADQRQWVRLDPASLAESWFRLQTPVAEPPMDGLASVLAARAADSSGRLSRSATLQSSYESWRESLPPGQSTVKPPDSFLCPANANVQWRRDSLFTLHGDIPDSAGDHRLYLAGAMLAGSGLSSASAKPRRFPSATLIPPVFSVGSFPNPEPVLISVSPYVGLSFQRLIPQESTPSLVYGDLICLNPSGNALQIVATQIWQGAQTGLDDGMRAWAKETRDRLATGSKVGILRLRSIQPALTDDPAQPETATVEYRFDILDYPVAEPVAQIAHPLRAALTRIHYEEGQLSDQLALKDLVDFEAAPPQVRGVQPIYESHRPIAANQPAPIDPDDEVWPWGVSAIRFHLQATEGVDPTDATKRQPFGVSGNGDFVWWQATSHFVQFASGTEHAIPALPRLFRANAIASMLPANPRATLPVIEPGDYTPVLPGAWDLIVTGARPGAPFVFRHHLIRQSKDKSMVASGSVPVQHRMPRPLAIPRTRKHVGPNPLPKLPMPQALDGRDFALLTWASYFTPDLSAGVTMQPCDAAFLVTGDASASGLSAALVSPWEIPQAGKAEPYFDNATIPPSWKGVLRFKMSDSATGNAPSGWSVRCSLEDDATSLDAMNGPVNPAVQTMFQFAGDNLTAFMAGKRHGDVVRAIVQAENSSTSVKGYRERMVFPLRVSLAGNLPSPMVPVFALFEDPEYNRKLISDTVRAQGMLVLVTGTQVAVTLAVDRRQYNPTSRGYVVYSIAQPTGAPALAIVISIVGKDGLPRGLRSPLEPPEPGDKTICEFSIDGEAQPGETLMVQLVIPGKPDNTILASLTAEIVADPVVPAVEAAFALLRLQSVAIKSSVACARFAWSPAATRIDLLNPDDLLNRETVRRRAVFQWTDVVRKTRDYAYAVQKIMPGGATYIGEVATFTTPTK